MMDSGTLGMATLYPCFKTKGYYYTNVRMFFGLKKVAAPGLLCIRSKFHEVQ